MTQLNNVNLITLRITDNKMCYTSLESLNYLLLDSTLTVERKEDLRMMNYNQDGRQRLLKKKISGFHNEAGIFC